MHVRRPRRKTLRVGVTISTGVAILVLGGPMGVASAAPAQAGDPCPEPFPVAELADGMEVSGLTVERGTTPDPFTGTVLGVIDDGIAPGLDMIMVEADSPAIQRAGGIWAGMSGSPVYAADGRLIGAVAYGLAASSPIAGITPAADMLTLLDRPTAEPAPADEVDIPVSIESEIVESGAATRAEAAAGMTRLPVPLGVSGLGQARLDEVTTRLEDDLPGVRAYSAGAVDADTPGSPSDIFPGSNFAAAIAHGDVTMGGVGTTTAVCTVGGRDVAIAFGHPFTFLGATAMGAHGADAVFVQPDAGFGPFKVANMGGVVGTLDQDRLVGIRSQLGTAPATTPVTSTIRSGDNGSSRTGTTQATMADFLPDAAFLHTLANFDRVADRIGGGTTELRWVINGRRASGAPFSVDVTDMYSDPGDVSFLSSIDVADQLFALVSNRFEDVTVTGVDLTGSVSSTYSQHRLESVLLRRPDGTFAPLPTDEPLRVVAGTRLNLRAVLAPYRGAGPVRNVDLSVVVPADTAGGFGSLEVTGGEGSFDDSEPANFDQLLTGLRGHTPNNAVAARLHVDAELPSGPIERDTSARGLTDAPVTGESFFDIEVVQPRQSLPAVVDGNVWKLRSSLSTGQPTSTYVFGTATSRRVMGDWDGNGAARTAAVFDNGRWTIRQSATSRVGFNFGLPGDVPVVGDWDGDGRDGIGVFRNGTWYLRNSMSAGPADLIFGFGQAGDVPVVGDWDGDGVDSIGVFRNGTWFLRFRNSAGPSDRRFAFGQAAGDRPVVGEWDRDGRDEVGIYRPGNQTWYLRDTMSAGPSNHRLTYGHGGSYPLTWS
jgi:hypothetical protein